MAHTEWGQIGYAERPWRRAPDDPALDGDIYASTPAERADTLHAALEGGVTLCHAVHEREAASLGRSLQLLGARDKVHVSTTDGDALARCPDTEAGAAVAIQAAIARKRTLLGIERIDLFHLYDVRSDVHTPARTIGAQKALSAAQEAGDIAAWGATCYGDYKTLARMINAGEFIPHQIVARFNFLDTRAMENLLPICGERGIPVLAAQTFGWVQGVSFPRFPNTWRLRNMAQNFLGASAGQLHLRWVLAQPNIAGALVSMQDKSQIRENIAAAKLPVPRADVTALFSSFVEAIMGTEEGWQALQSDEQWEVRVAAEAWIRRG